MPLLPISDPLDTNQLYTDFRAKVAELDQAADPIDPREVLALCKALFAFHFNEPI